MASMHVARIGFLALAFTLTGCKPDDALRKPGVIGNQDKTAVAPVDASQFGSISGSVTFAGKAPAPVKIDMSMDPACTFGADNMSEQYAVRNGKLANVYIYIKDGASPTKAAPGTPAVVLDQKGCKYMPHVIAIQQGGTVEFRNSDSTMHNIHTMPSAVGNQNVDVSQGPMGQPQVRQFASPEVMMPVRCNNHPWMNAYLNISPNPYFAVTGAEGNFTLNLPPGTYTVAAVHEKLGEQDVQITVPAKGAAKANFNFAAK